MALAPSPSWNLGLIFASYTNLYIVAQAEESSCEERTAQEAKKLPVGVDVPEEKQN